MVLNDKRVALVYELVDGGGDCGGGECKRVTGRCAWQHDRETSFILGFLGEEACTTVVSRSGFRGVATTNTAKEIAGFVLGIHRA